MDEDTTNGDSLDASSQSMYYQGSDYMDTENADEVIPSEREDINTAHSSALDNYWTSISDDINNCDEDILLPKPSLLPQPLFIKGNRKTRKEQETEEREKLQVLVSSFTEEQLDRYEMFRRAAFPKAAVKRIMQTITGCSVSQNVVIAMAGIAKVFIGEVVEEALDVMESYGESGPLQPKHLREGVRRLRTSSGQHIPSMNQKRPPFLY